MKTVFARTRPRAHATIHCEDDALQAGRETARSTALEQAGGSERVATTVTKGRSRPPLTVTQDSWPRTAVRPSGK